MEKKEIQEERMRNYFLTAATDIIRGEGLAAVSARTVADRAGYSYATLYNYFKDIRDLIFCCVEKFMQECRDFVAQETRNAGPGRDRIQATAKGYAKFFVQYPGIFELLYVKNPGDIASKRSPFENLGPFFDTLTGPGWQELEAKAKSDGEEMARTREAHKMAVHGLLLFYLNRRNTLGYKQFMEEIEYFGEKLIPAKGK